MLVKLIHRVFILGKSDSGDTGINNMIAACGATASSFAENE